MAEYNTEQLLTATRAYIDGKVEATIKDMLEAMVSEGIIGDYTMTYNRTTDRYTFTFGGAQ